MFKIIQINIAYSMKEEHTESLPYWSVPIANVIKKHNFNKPERFRKYKGTNF